VEEGEDGALLYNPDKDHSVLVNRSGREVWSFLAAPHSLEEVARHLTVAFTEVTTELAEQDAEKFLQALQPDFIVAKS